MAMRSGAENRRPAELKADFRPVYKVPQHGLYAPHAEDSGSVIADLVSVLSAGERGSTAEALAFLRQLYPRYPLTLRLAALVAHAKANPQPRAAERPVAQ